MRRLPKPTRQTRRATRTLAVALAFSLATPGIAAAQINSAQSSDVLLNPVGDPGFSSSPAQEAVGSAIGSSLPSLGSSQTDPHPATPAFTPAHIVDREQVGPAEWRVHIYSPSMDQVITNTIVVGQGTAPRPNVVLLPGLGGGENEHWTRQADIPGYFGDKDVNVVSIHGGAGSMFTNWLKPHPSKGTVAWETYLGQELPLILEQEFYGNGRNAIAGISMSGSSALDIAGRFPETYQATASLSGFPATSGAFGWAMLFYVTMKHGGTPMDVWGSLFNPAWRDHDPAVTTARLRGSHVFVGHATGAPGAIDRMNDNNPFEVTISELMSAEISKYYVRRAWADGVNVNYTVLPQGRHTFGVFETLLHRAWESTFVPALYPEAQ